MTSNAQQLSHMPPTPWSLDDAAEIRFRKISRNIFIAVVLLALIIGLIPLKKEERRDIEEVPPAVAKLIMERQQQPPPPKPKPKPKPKKPKPEPKKQVKKPKPKTPKPKPKTKPQPTARQKAEQVAASWMSELPAMNEDPVAKLEIDKPLKRGAGKAAPVKRDVIADPDVTKPGGTAVNPNFKRGAGKVELQKRSTTKIAKAGGSADSGGSKGKKSGSSGSSKGSGGVSQRSRADVVLYLDKRKGLFHRMYQRALRKNPALQGQVVVTFTVLPSGSVTNCKIISSELNDPKLERKIIALFNSFNFGSLDVSKIKFNYPIDFFPESS